MLRAICLSIGLVVASAGATTTATADDGAESEERSAALDRDARARQLFEHGREAYEDGRYEEAAQSFERAFELSGRPMLLINTANAWDRLREDARAAAALRQYLVLVPDADDRASIEARVDALEHAASAPAETAPPAPDGLLAGRTWTWVAAAGAVLLGAVSGWLWLDAEGDYDLLAGTCGRDGSCTDAQVDSVRGTVTASHVTLAVAGGALAAAAALYLLEGPPEMEPRALTVGPTLGGVQVGGAF